MTRHSLGWFERLLLALAIGLPYAAPVPKPVPVPAPAPKPSPAPAPPAVAAPLDALNAWRSSRGLAPLRPAADLAAAAGAWARAMDARGLMTHGVGTEAFGVRIRDYRATGWAGENVGVAPSAAEAVRRWAGDAAHLKNMTDPRFRTAGFAGAGGYWCLDVGE